MVVASGVDQQKAAPLGLFVLILLGVACYFLFKSMSRHLRRVRDDFPSAGYSPSEGVAPDIVRGDGLARPAPVSLTRGRLNQPGVTPQRVGDPPVTEPRAIDPPATRDPDSGS